MGLVSDDRLRRQGLPAATTLAGKSRMTALPAPITVFAPVMPGQTTAYGLRSVSRVHRDKPYVFVAGHEEHRVDYVPGEGTSYLFAATPSGAARSGSRSITPSSKHSERYHHVYGNKF